MGSCGVRLLKFNSLSIWAAMARRSLLTPTGLASKGSSLRTARAPIPLAALKITSGHAQQRA